MTMSLERSTLPADDLPPEAAARPLEAINEDDVPGLTIEDALAIRALLDAHTPEAPEPVAEPSAASVADGWEERARNTQPGRAYDVEAVVDQSHAVPRGVGSTAVASEIGMGHLPYGMPRRPHVISSFSGSQRFPRY